jgi:hypothetical protein
VLQFFILMSICAVVFQPAEEGAQRYQVVNGRGAAEENSLSGGDSPRGGSSMADVGAPPPHVYRGA